MDSRLIEGDGPFALLWTAPEMAGSAWHSHSEGSEWGGKQEIRLTETTYHYRIFLCKCETYAVRLNGSEVTGICGPLEYDEVLFSALPRFQYDDDPYTLAWVRSNWGDSVYCETEYEEGMLRV